MSKPKIHLNRPISEARAHGTYICGATTQNGLGVSRDDLVQVTCRKRIEWRGEVSRGIRNW